MYFPTKPLRGIIHMIIIYIFFVCCKLSVHSVSYFGVLGNPALLKVEINGFSWSLGFSSCFWFLALFCITFHFLSPFLRFPSVPLVIVLSLLPSVSSSSCSQLCVVVLPLSVFQSLGSCALSWIAVCVQSGPDSLWCPFLFWFFRLWLWGLPFCSLPLFCLNNTCILLSPVAARLLCLRLGPA